MHNLAVVRPDVQLLGAVSVYLSAIETEGILL
jgi:hypothetical protein